MYATIKIFNSGNRLSKGCIDILTEMYYPLVGITTMNVQAALAGQTVKFQNSSIMSSAKE
ncbi:hypothetical protein SAMN05660649_00541 [Desulfotomaculum arcticum]|uniref:Uncharacterized protein n=1 Tax=Desulfotruncus arcticus DSM 17038 TaxID=1121424 RepID=A0A1I2NRP0_9FIRM|nr:hypothetical protein SAMN05660649_00541 [Desulfotomaculum arcticum] [Desulfotruncus arcticus DSM 17038]